MAGDRVISSDVEVGDVAFLAGGSALAGLCRDNKLRIWDVRSGALKRTVAWDEGATVRLAAEVDRLGAAGKDGIHVWDLKSEEPDRRIAGLPERVRRLEFSRDGAMLAGGGSVSGRSETTLRVWDAGGEERFNVAAGLGGTSAIAFSPDGGTVVAASYDTNVRAFSSRNGELLRLIEELPLSMFALAFSPDGRYLAAAGADRIVYLYDAKSWKLARKLTGQPEMIASLAFSRDGRWLATGGMSEFTTQNPVKILLWDLASGKVTRSFPADHMVGSVAFSPDGALVAASSRQKDVRLWAIGQ